MPTEVPFNACLRDFDPTSDTAVVRICAQPDDGRKLPKIREDFSEREQRLREHVSIAAFRETIRAEARREALLEALAVCDVCGRVTGGCCAVVVGSPGVVAVDRYREHIRALLNPKYAVSPTPADGGERDADRRVPRR